MRIFTRYILKEVLSHGLIGVAVFTFVIFMRDVSRILELVVRNSAPIPSIAELFFLTLPGVFVVTIPMGVLVGILIGLSRMAADSEITAMRAAGIGVFKFVQVLALFGFVAWLLALVNSLLIAPRSAAALASLQNSLASSQVTFEVQPRVFFEDPNKNYVLYVQDATTASGAAIWKNVFLADTSTPGASKITVAEQAVVSNGKDSIHLHLENGATHEVNVHEPGQYTISTFDENDINLSLPPTPKQAQEIVPMQQLNTRELLWLSYHTPKPAVARSYWIEFNRRLALSTASIVLVLIGIPLGLSSKKGGKGAAFVLAIVLVFIYYLLYLSGLTLARNGRLPAILGVWLANIVFSVIGVLLLWRVDKMPIEIGLGQFLMEEWKKGKAAWFKKKEEERVAVRQRFHKRFPLILDDYVIRNFLSHLTLIVASLMVLVLVFTFFELLSDIIRNRIPLVTVGEYLLNVIPSVLYQVVVPLSVLLAVVVTLGLMQKSNEITAMKATGISIYRTVTPMLIICALLAFGLFVLEEMYLPYANKRVETLRNTIKEKPAQTYLRPDRKWIFGQHNTIYYYEFYDPETDQFGSISAFEFEPHTFQITKRIYATQAHWEPSLQEWVYERGWQRSFRGPAIEKFEQFKIGEFAELNEPPTYFKKEVLQSQEMNYAQLSSYIHDLQQAGFDVVRLRVQLQKKLAFPLITLVMAVLAVPFALSAGRRGALTGVAVALLLGVVYWVTSGLFEAMGNVNQLPPALAAWSPDVIFCLAGGYLVLKTPS